MQIEEKQIVINGQNIILRSPKKQDAETFQRCVTSLTVKRIFWRDTRRRQILQQKQQRR